MEKDIISNGVTLIYIKDKKGMLVNCSASLAELCGYDSTRDVIGKDTSDLFTKIFDEKNEQNDTKVMECEKPLKFIEEITNEKNETQTYLTYKTSLNIKNIKYVMSISHDITSYTKNQKQMQQRLTKLHNEKKDLHKIANDYIQYYLGFPEMKSQSPKNSLKAILHFFDTLIADMPALVYWVDRNNIFCGGNNNEAKVFRLNNRKELLGKSYYDLMPKEMADPFLKVNQQMYDTQTEVIAEEIGPTHLSEKPAVYLSSKVPLKNEKGEVIGLFGFSQDITELKNTQKELERTKDKLEKVSAMRIKMLRNMEHDIRTPISGILGVLKILISAENNQQKLEHMQKIKNSTRELLDYCNKIIEMASFDTIEIPIQAKSFNIRKLVTKVIELETPAALAKNTQIDVQIDEKTPKIVIGDEFRLQSILINVISNAIKHTKSNTINVKVDLQTCNDDSYIVKFTIKDCGAGFPRKVEQYLFANDDVFCPDIGSGCRLIKQFIKELKGEIFIKSSATTGTEFAFCIKYARSLFN